MSMPIHDLSYPFPIPYTYMIMIVYYGDAGLSTGCHAAFSIHFFITLEVHI